MQKRSLAVVSAVIGLLFCCSLVFNEKEGEVTATVVKASPRKPRSLHGEVLLRPAEGSARATFTGAPAEKMPKLRSADPLADGTLRCFRVNPDLSFIGDVISGRETSLVFDTGSSEMVLNIRRAVQNKPHSWTFFGKVEGRESSSVIGTVNESAFVLDVRGGRPGEDWIVLPVEGGHEMRQMNWARLPVCGGSRDPEIKDQTASVPPFRQRVSSGLSADTAGDSGTPAAGGAAAPEAANDSGEVIDVMIIYNFGARTWAGGQAGIDAMIFQAVNQTNLSFSDSQISTSFRLVHSEGISYTATNLDTDLERLTGRQDGAIDSIHTLREQYQADIVSFWTDGNVRDPGYSGVGWLLRTPDIDFSHRAFNVCSISLAVGNYTFSHECGHNLGCMHDAENSIGSVGVNVDSYGWRWFDSDGNEFRTIMAYPPGTRLPYFSNPDVSVGGFPTGKRGEANNAATINQTKTAAANWRNVADQILLPPSTSLTNLAQVQSFRVILEGDWTWEFAALAPWVTTTMLPVQSGERNFTYSVSANNSTSPRTVQILITSGQNVHTYTIEQAGATLGISPVSSALAADGGLRYFSIVSQMTWNWSADADWILAPTEPASQFATQQFGFTVTPNTTRSPRSATITIEQSDGSSLTHTIEQLAGELAPLPPSRLVSALGGVTEIGIETDLSWGWTLPSGWVRSTEAAQQSGDQTFTYSFDANTGGRRTADLGLSSGPLQGIHTIIQESAQAIELHSYVGEGSVSPLFLNQGAVLTAGVPVRSLGGLPSSATTVSFYLSADTSVSPADIFVGSAPLPGIAAGAIHQVQAGDLQVPSALPPGDYYLGWIIDPANSVSESDEDNNSGYAPVQVSVAPAPIITAITQTLAQDSISVWDSLERSNLATAILTTAEGVSSRAFDSAGVLSLTPPVPLGLLKASAASGPLANEGTGNSGIHVRRHISLVSGRHAADEEITVTNTSGSTVGLVATLLDDYGSDSATTVHGSSSGDAALTPADSWFVISDKATPGQISGPPAVMVSWQSYGLQNGLVQLQTPTAGTDKFQLGAGPLQLGAGRSFRIVVRRELADTASALLASGSPLPPPPQITDFAIRSLEVNNDDIVLSFRSHAGLAHRIVSTTELNGGIWTPVAGHEAIQGDGSVMTRTLQGMAAGPASRRWFRVEIP